jgi:hypothetical protein
MPIPRVRPTAQMRFRSHFLRRHPFGNDQPRRHGSGVPESRPHLAAATRRHSLACTFLFQRDGTLVAQTGTARRYRPVGQLHRRQRDERPRRQADRAFARSEALFGEPYRSLRRRRRSFRSSKRNMSVRKLSVRRAVPSSRRAPRWASPAAASASASRQPVFVGSGSHASDHPVPRERRLMRTPAQPLLIAGVLRTTSRSKRLQARSVSASVVTGSTSATVTRNHARNLSRCHRCSRRFQRRLEL